MIDSLWVLQSQLAPMDHKKTVVPACAPGLRLESEEEDSPRKRVFCNAAIKYSNTNKWFDERYKNIWLASYYTVGEL